MKRTTSIRNRFNKIIAWFSALQGKVTRRFQMLKLKLPAPLLAVLPVLKTTVSLFRTHSTGTLGAGLSYYMLFSIAPIMVIVISAIGTILGQGAVTGVLKQQIESVLGSGYGYYGEIQTLLCISKCHQPTTHLI